MRQWLANFIFKHSSLHREFCEEFSRLSMKHENHKKELGNSFNYLYSLQKIYNRMIIEFINKEGLPEGKISKDNYEKLSHIIFGAAKQEGTDQSYFLADLITKELAKKIETGVEFHSENQESLAEENNVVNLVPPSAAQNEESGLIIDEQGFDQNGEYHPETTFPESEEEAMQRMAARKNKSKE